jgi:hypothetical protein
MTANSEEPQCHPDNVGFFEKVDRTFRELCERAKAANELHFALALFPEFRGMQDAGWNTAQEANRIFDDYTTLLEKLDHGSTIRTRVALSLYVQLAEGSGFYETPKKLLLTVEGKGNNTTPFNPLVTRRRTTGQIIAPNASKVIGDLVEHAAALGMQELAEVFRDSFDADLRNGYAHSDYVIWRDGLRLPKRNGGQPRLIPWDDVAMLFERGINLFAIIREIWVEYTRSYETPKVVRGQLDNEPTADWVVYSNPKTKSFGITTRSLAEVLKEMKDAP